MASLITNLVAKRIFSETLANKQGTEDPYFERVPTRRLGLTGYKEKLKKVKKALPPGLSAEDERTLVKVKRRAYRLDMALGSFFGLKVGYGSLIGILPVIGDFGDLVLALMVVRTASAANIPHAVLLHMLVNIIFDFVIGLVPLLGDVVDMAYKANTRNAVLLENYLRERGRENLKKQGRHGVEDLSLGDGEAETGTVDGADRRAHGGRRREYDVEAQRGPPPMREQDYGATRGPAVPPVAKKSSGKKKGHARLYSQETGTAARH